MSPGVNRNIFEYKTLALTHTEEVHILLPRVPNGGVLLWRTLRDLEGGSRDDDIGGISTAGPFLAICAVAERSHFGFACPDF